MKTGPRLKVSSNRRLKSGIEPATPGLQVSGLSTTPQRLLFPEDVIIVLSKQTGQTLMKCRLMLHFICVFTVCQSTCLPVFRVKRVIQSKPRSVGYQDLYCYLTMNLYYNEIAAQELLEFRSCYSIYNSKRTMGF